MMQCRTKSFICDISTVCAPNCDHIVFYKLLIQHVNFLTRT